MLLVARILSTNGSGRKESVGVAGDDGASSPEQILMTGMNALVQLPIMMRKRDTARCNVYLCSTKIWTCNSIQIRVYVPASMSACTLFTSSADTKFATYSPSWDQ